MLQKVKFVGTDYFDDLSEREKQVFIKLGCGVRLTDIAASLSISVKTASTYRTRAMEKMGMSNDAQITAYCVINGLFSL
jgi:two-component system, NarL family, invasion response regulator UvrY